MGIIWPSDHDDADQWDAIMDTAVRGVIDAHTHAPGDGAQILLSSVKVDQDISWASGGTKFAITDLKAVDFFPSAAADVAGMTGAFFISDGTGGLTLNELYFRTMGGANVKFTAGATLNVGAFTGGFGGDYVSAGALAEFNDASDAYWFEQQVGASVRQYAKMRSADLALFEFKAVGATPVPTQAVTLKSPAALGASYALTFPGALPGSTVLAQVDSTGAMSFSNTLAANQSITISGTASYRQGTKSINIPLRAADVIMTAGTILVPATAYGFAFVANDAGYILLPELPAHWRIVNVTMGFTIAGDRANTTLSLAQSGTGDAATTTISDIASTTFTNTGTAKKQIAGVNLTPSTGQVYFVKFAIAAGGVAGKLANLVIDYDIPV
jgi:hypothetical protein